MNEPNTQSSPVVKEQSDIKPDHELHLLSDEFYDKVLDHYIDSVCNYVTEVNKDGPEFKGFVQGFGVTPNGKEPLGRNMVREIDIHNNGRASAEKVATVISNMLLFTTNQGRKIRDLEQIVSQQQDQINQLLSLVKIAQCKEPEPTPHETTKPFKCFYCQPDCYYRTCYGEDESNDTTET